MRRSNLFSIARRIIWITLVTFFILGLAGNRDSLPTPQEVEGTLLTSKDLPPENSAVPDNLAGSPLQYIALFSCQPSDRLSGLTVEGRSWNLGSNFLITDIATEAVTKDAASALQSSASKCTASFPEFPVEQVSGAEGHSIQTAAQGVQLLRTVITFRRGAWVYFITSLQPQPGSDSIAKEIASLQANRAPDGDSTPDPELITPQSDLAGTAGGILGILATWMILLPAITDRISDRARRRRHRTVPQSSARPTQQWNSRIIDIDQIAKKDRRRARNLLLIEILLIDMLVVGLVLLATHRLAAILVLSATLAGTIAVQRVRRRIFAVQRGAWYKQPISSIAISTISALIACLGLGLLVESSIVNDNRGLYALQTGRSNLSTVLLLSSIAAFGLAVALHRLAVRIRLSRPAQATLADDRQPILYLRSFVDDRLERRVAPFARRSLIERLSARRKQGFEELAAEELQRSGPLLAVAEPGRRLAPIGFARQALSDSEWQSGVWQLMQCARAVVLVLGRGAGLEWESQAIVRSGAWQKTLFVFPPVPKEDLAQRWGRLSYLLNYCGLRQANGHAPDTCLVATFDRTGRCLFYCANNANAWSYKAALGAALMAISLPGPGNDNRPESTNVHYRIA